MVDFEKVKEVKNATVQLFEEQWRRNFAINRSSVLRNPGVKALLDRFRNVPAVIVGAGPSLDKNIKYLKFIQDKALIIACDAALKCLLEEGITPSFVTTLDPQEKILRFFEGLKTANLTLVTPTVAHPAIIEFWKGRVVFYNKFAPDIPVLTQIQREASNVGDLIPGGTVLSISYSLAFQAGANPITFIGQDLSYPEGVSYSRSTIYKNITRDTVLETQAENIVHDTDIFGGVLPTIKSMFVTKQWMEWAFSSWKRSITTDIINSTEGGILREKCSILPLGEFLFCHSGKKYNFGWTIQKLLKYKV